MRSPSVLSDSSVSPSFLRTTPAKNPRTECCCQSVSFIIPAIVAPAGDCNMAMTRACFETALVDLDGLTAAGLDAFRVFIRFTLDFGKHFIADFVIENSFGCRGVAPHHR